MLILYIFIYSHISLFFSLANLVFLIYLNLHLEYLSCIYSWSPPRFNLHRSSILYFSLNSLKHFQSFFTYISIHIIYATSPVLSCPCLQGVIHNSSLYLPYDRFLISTRFFYLRLLCHYFLCVVLSSPSPASFFISHSLHLSLTPTVCSMSVLYSFINSSLAFLALAWHLYRQHPLTDIPSVSSPHMSTPSQSGLPHLLLNALSSISIYSRKLVYIMAFFTYLICQTITA